MLDRVVQIAGAVLLVAALLLIQALIGGTRFIFAVPSYALLALLGLLGVIALRAPRPRPDTACLISVAVFFGYALLRAFLSPDSYLARSDITIILPALVIYFLTATTLSSSPLRMSVLACLLAAAVVHVGVGAIQFRNGNNFMPISFLQRFDYGRRASGFYICPDHLAGMLEVVGLFGLSVVCWSRWPAWAKMLIGYATAMCYLGLILSGSRGGYLSAAASLVVFAFLSIRVLRAGGSVIMWRAGLSGLVVAIAGLTTAVVIVKKSDYLSDRTRKAVIDRDFRLQVWQAALEQSRLSPVFGTGSRTYQYYGRKFRSPGMQRDPVYAHNDYLQLLAEYGVIGLAASGFFLFAHCRRGWADSARLGPKRIAMSGRLLSNAMALNIAALSAIAAYMVHSVVDFNLHIPANALLLAFVFGILANPGVQFESRANVKLVPLMWGRGAAAAAALALALLIYRFAPGEYQAEHARTALRDYRPLSAVAFARQAIEQDDRNPLAYYYLGRARTQAGDRLRSREGAESFYLAAIEPFERAQALAPLDETYAIELALTFDSLQRFSEAEWLFDQALEMDPRSTALREYYRGHIERWKKAGAAPQT